MDAFRYFKEEGRANSRYLYIYAIVILLFSGAGYRIMATWLSGPQRVNSSLPVSLENFPVVIGNWWGEDLPIPQYVLEKKYSDFLNRKFVNHQTGDRVNLYLAYTSQPRTMLGHRPQVCYVANGWVWQSSIESQFTTISGRSIPCMIHRFSRSGSIAEEIVILNFYILNGQVTNQESDFSGLKWRIPNVDGFKFRYVVQIQILSFLENIDRAFAEDMADTIINYFLDKNVKADLDGGVALTAKNKALCG